MHGGATVGVVEGGNVQRGSAGDWSAGDIRIDAVSTLADELLAKVGVGPEATRDANLSGVVDEDEGLVVGGVGRAPPVQVTVGVGDSEEVVDVIRPSDTVTLVVTAAGVPKKPVSDLIGVYEVR